MQTAWEWISKYHLLRRNNDDIIETFVINQKHIKIVNGVWLSLVERYVRDVEAAGSNPVTPSKNRMYPEDASFSYSMRLFN